MLGIPQKDTDLINELVADFGRNQNKIAILVQTVNNESKINLDPIAQAKIVALRRAILVEDVKNQELKIKMMDDILKQICSPLILSKE